MAHAIHIGLAPKVQNCRSNHETPLLQTPPGCSFLWRWSAWRSVCLVVPFVLTVGGPLLYSLQALERLLVRSPRACAMTYRQVHTGRALQLRQSKRRYDICSLQGRNPDQRAPLTQPHPSPGILLLLKEPFGAHSCKCLFIYLSLECISHGGHGRMTR
jgi:hypothetical protein